MLTSEAVFEDARARCVVALGAGAFAAAGFAPIGATLFLLMGLCLLAYLVCGAASPKRAFLEGYLWAIAYFGFGLRWVLPAMHTHGGVPFVLALLGLLALAGVLALLPAVAAAAIRWVPVALGWRLLLVFPCLLTLSELIRGEWLFSFGWLSPGYAFADNLLGAWAPLLGVYGVGFVVAVLAGAAPVALSSRFGRTERLVAAALMGGVVLCAYGIEDVVWSKPGRTFEARLVQPALPVTIRPKMSVQLAALERVEAMSMRSPMSRRLDWIVWPESVYLTSLERLPASEGERPLTVARRMDTSVIFNAFTEPKRGDYYNAIFCADAGIQKLQYAKRHRVPFGEYVPFGFRWLVDALRIPMADQCAGDRPAQAVDLNGTRVGLGVCYENLFGSELSDWFRGEAGAMPEVLLFVANLGWFDDAVARQFTQISQMRARETARPVLQAINNANSAYINPRGNIERQAGFGAENLDVTVRRYRGETTPVVRYGLWPLTSLILFVLLALVGWGFKTKNRLLSIR